MKDKNKDWLEISDLNKFTDYIRNIVYVNFKEGDTDEDYYEVDLNQCFDKLTLEEIEELEKILNKEECAIIIKEKSKKIKNKKTKQIKYLMDDKILYSIIEDINQRMVSNIIQGLVQKGLLETAFDSDSNDFVFWVKE